MVAPPTQKSSRTSGGGPPPRLRASVNGSESTPSTFRSSPPSLSVLPRLRVTRSLQYGRVALDHFLWRQLRLHTAVIESLNGTPAKGRVAHLLELMVLNRLDYLTSKLGLWTGCRARPPPSSQAFLSPRLTMTSFTRPWRRIGPTGTPWSNASTSISCAPRATPPGCSIMISLTPTTRAGGCFAGFGYSRGHRGDRPQISWEIVDAPEGLPITL